MDYQQYLDAYFVQPQPTPRFAFESLNAITLFFEAFAEAVAFYREVLGEPAYSEGAYTRGWRIGSGWLTLLKGRKGNPANVEVAIFMQSPAEADRLWQAMVAAGAQPGVVTDTLMYEPVHLCPVTDPLGTQLLIIARREMDT